MVDIGSTPPIVASLPSPTAAKAGQGSPAPAAPAPLPGAGKTADVTFDAQVAEQKRAAAVQEMSQQVADVYVLGDQSFTIFKDVTGQYITRFTSLRDGKVTYFPEPVIYKMSNATGDSGTGPLVNINA
jgi:hypothetical protein